MKVIINGACGRMGQTVRELIEKKESQAMSVVAGVDLSASAGESGLYAALDDYTGEADVIIDFSNHAATQALVRYALSRELPCVIATTGQTEKELAAIEAASHKIPIFFAANYSLGIALIKRFAKSAAAFLPTPEVEIVEVHHDQKLDAPSGTALALAQAVASEIPHAQFVYDRSGLGKRTPQEIDIHSLRLGHVVGEHEVIISSGDEIISLKHTAWSRQLFGEGALAAAAFVVDKPAGMYGMDDLVKARFGEN